MNGVKEHCNVLVTSAGRRPYLVGWFRDALDTVGVTGRVIVADSDRFAASRSAADEFVLAPPVHSAEYAEWLLGTLERFDVSLAVSLNDFELSAWSELDDRLPRSVIRLDPQTQSMVEDKLRTYETLSSAGVPTPPTLLGGEVLGAPDVFTDADGFVVKNRFGSGSLGLQVVDRAGLLDGIAKVAAAAHDSRGRPVLDEAAALSSVVVQPTVTGTEFGLDVICDLEGAFGAALARKKISMRAGETDKATSADVTPFVALAAQLAHAVPHPGLADCDVIVDGEGQPWVIDVNPRFGGGYPFSHVAGADIPAAYIAWAAGRAVDPSWLEARANVTSAKFVGVAMVEGDS